MLTSSNRLGHGRLVITTNATTAPLLSSTKSFTMSINVLYTTGINQEIYSFSTIEEKNRWDAEVMAIKADSSAAFHRKESEGLSAAVRALYSNWISRVKAFVSQFGEQRTPEDIKWALNTAEEAMGVEATTWQSPPNASIFE